MHNYRAERADPHSLVVNQRIVEAHVNSEHYIRWVYPRDMHPEVTASGLGVPTYGELSTHDHFLEIPDAGTPTFLFKMARPEQWKAGLVELTVFYTGSASSTAAITMRCRAKRSKVGTALATLPVATPPLADGFLPMPGPTTAGDQLSSLWPAYLPITAEWLMMKFWMNRNPADAYTGTVRILAARLRYIPGQHVA